MPFYFIRNKYQKGPTFPGGTVSFEMVYLFTGMNHIAMKQDFHFLLIILIITLGVSGCKKTETNPCEGLLSEGPPSEIIIKIIDRQTKETLVVDASAIKITEKKSGFVIYYMVRDITNTG